MRPAQGTFQALAPVHRAWGLRRIISQPAPAAGKEWSFTTGGFGLTQILSATVQLVTSAQVPKRAPGISITDGDGKVLLVLTSAAEFAAALTRRISVVEGVAPNVLTASGPAVINIPPLLLERGYSINSVTEGLQTEDQYGELTLWVEEFEEDPVHPLAEIAADVSRIINLERAASYATSQS